MTNMRGLILPFVLQALVYSRQAAASYCYYDSYSNYTCTYYYLSTGSLVGIAISVIIFIILLISLCVVKRKRAARNALLLQNQQQQPNTWVPPPGQMPYGYPNNGAYPMQPNPTGGYMNNGPQPFQPGYVGGYAPGAGGPGVAPKGYDFESNTTGNVQEPPRSYNPGQAVYTPPTNSPPPTTTHVANDPPTYSGFSAPTGVPAHATGGSNNPYYTPQDTTKV